MLEADERGAERAAYNKQMSVRLWNDDDGGYKDWLAHHPMGFQANTNRPIGGSYFMIHKALCTLRDRSNPATNNPRTGNRYLKLTAETIDELLEWARNDLKIERGEDLFCQICNPRSEP